MSAGSHWTGDFEDTESIWHAMPLAVASLADEIAGMQNDTGTVADLARQLCAGVGYVHARGILHRDLKPGDILRGLDGNWQVADFGLAREDERLSMVLTSTTAKGPGTSMLASPEQWNSPMYAGRASVRVTTIWRTHRRDWKANGSEDADHPGR